MPDDTPPDASSQDPPTPPGPGGGSPFDSGEFFAQGGAGPASPARVGPYQIVRRIGKGGMGVVYLARRTDDQFRQLVALKIARVGVDSDEYLRRFKREREVLYGLNHPNIARILDGGTTEDGQPYFVMEYVDGQRLDHYCDEHRLSTIDRLRLFARVCDAIRYCHSNLVVHRDIKPGNILVSSRGEPKILDFGIAKLLDPTQSAFTAETQPSVRLMTFAYASPEQVRGSMITPSSDIYSLGVLLYELLTGRMPYNLGEQVRARIEDVICNVPPEPPSTAITKPYEKRLADGTTSTVRPEEVARLQESKPTNLRRKLSGDIDDIVMVALAKTPRLRYESAEQFLRDIENHLAGRPVEARRIRRSVNWSIYAGRRFVGRHRVGLAALSAALVALSVGLGLATWQWREAEAQRRAAEAAEARTRLLAGELIQEVHDRVLPLAGSVAIRQRLMELGNAELERSVERAGRGDAATLLDLALGYDRVGDVAAGVRTPHAGDVAAAAEAYARARGLRDAAGAAGAPPADVDHALAQSDLREGDVARERGDNDAASALYRRGVDRLAPAGAALDDDAVTTLALLREALANALIREDQARHRDEALALLRDAEADARALLLRAPTDQRRETLARLLHTLGEHHYLRNTDYAIATPYFLEAVRLRELAFGGRPTDAYIRSRLAGSQLYAGQCLVALDRRGEGEPLLDAARGHLAFLVEADPDDASARLRLGIASEQIGRTFERIDPPRAIESFEAAARLGEQALTGGPETFGARRLVASSSYRLATTLRRDSQWRRSLDAHERARRSLVELLALPGTAPERFAPQLADVCYSQLYTLSRLGAATHGADPPDPQALTALAARELEVERALEDTASVLADAARASAAGGDPVNAALDRVRSMQTKLAEMRGDS
jgi:serine/threonine protein kinase/tetratricopeptide (TPR) repeat protein